MERSERERTNGERGKERERRQQWWRGYRSRLHAESELWRSQSVALSLFYLLSLFFACRLSRHYNLYCIVSIV